MGTDHGKSAHEIVEFELARCEAFMERRAAHAAAG
jgi:hypothetical protein